MTVHSRTRPDFSVHAPAAGAKAADCAPRNTLKRLIIRRFERGMGAQFAALAADARYTLWRMSHRDGTYAEFYAQSIAARLERGGSHRTLGAQDYWTEFLPYSSATRDASDFRARGRNYFDWFLSRGLKPDMTCIDYGCGSLRVGQHFIEYLDTGRYLGLDIIDRFYRDGMSMMEGNVILRRQPRFLVITDEALERAREAEADLIFSTSVLQHVPPDEVARFLGNIIGLMHDDCVAIIHFRAAMTPARIAANSWTHAPASLMTAIACISPKMHTRIEDGVSTGDPRYYRAVLVLSRNLRLLRQWFRQRPMASHTASPSLPFTESPS